MKNSMDKEQSLNTSWKYKKNPEMEKLWKNVFKDQYKPKAGIDFKKVKDFFVTQKKEHGYISIREYDNDILMDPIELCDILIQHPHKAQDISFLESIPKDIKRAVADLLMSLAWDFTTIQNTFWDALLFRIRHNCYPYSNKRNEKLKNFFLSTDTFLHSEREYSLLEKAYNWSWGPYPKNKDIMSTLISFTMMRQLPDDLLTEDIQKYLYTHISNDFSLAAFSTRHEHLKGKEENRYRKDIDKNGDMIDHDTIRKTSIHETSDNPKKERSLEVVNRDNPDIYKDRSWETYKIYLDGPMGIWLFHNKKPVALISFSLSDPETLFIQQMQTVVADHYDRYGRTTHQSVDPIVHTISRQKLLYDIAVLLAKKYQCKKIVIKSWENNQRINENRIELQYDDSKEKLIEVQIDKPHLSLDIAKQIYNVFAKQQKFKRNKQTMNRDKEI